MEIERLNYSIRTKKKYKVIHEDKRYTCYIQVCENNIVCTGDGMTGVSKDITDTELGQRIILECLRSGK